MRISDWSSDVGSSDLFDCRVFWGPSSPCLSLEGGPATIALDIHLEDGGVMNETVDGRERHGGIREDPVPFAEGLVGRDEHGSALIACADQLEEHGGCSLILGDIGGVERKSQRLNSSP